MKLSYRLPAFLFVLFAFLYPIPSALDLVYAQQATLSLSPSSGNFNQGCPFSLEIKLDTAGAQTDGTDAILFYDTTRISATTITNGTIYADYPGNNIDDTSGKVTISGLASISSPFSGQGTLATINFKVKETAQAGATQIKFDFDGNNKSKTTDSNVVQRGTVVDILSSVTNGSYTIGTGTCGQVSTLPNTGAPGATIATPSGQPTIYKTLPPAGSENLTFALAILGSVLTVLGVLGLALL